jgi:hypothetical protein
MDLKSLNIVFLIVLILSVTLLPVLAGAGILRFSEEDNIAERDDFFIIDNYSATWMRMPVHQLSDFLGFGISIFVLFIVYLGGRSKHKRFNDRTIDLVNALIAAFLKTARLRAVFNFQSLDQHSQEIRSGLCK